jgi:hypothetical protein
MVWWHGHKETLAVVAAAAAVACCCRKTNGGLASSGRSEITVAAVAAASEWSLPLCPVMVVASPAAIGETLHYHMWHLKIARGLWWWWWWRRFCKCALAEAERFALVAAVAATERVAAATAPERVTAAAAAAGTFDAAAEGTTFVAAPVPCGGGCSCC